MEWSRIRSTCHAPVRWCSIVGAPRCGTTSLARYLNGHPRICLSNVKEPHFFSRRDLGSLAPDALSRLLQEDYVDHFFPNLPDRATMLDASVSYLYAPERLAPVAATWPDSKFIIAVRNPLDMLPSLHQRHVCNGDENVLEFEKAWNLIDDRRHGRRIPRSCIDSRLLDYEEIGRLGKYVRRFLAIVGSERCFVSIFDDLIADPAAHYGRILQFLGLPPEPCTDFTPCRSSQGVRIPALQRLLKRPPAIVRSLVASDADLHREAIATDRKPMGARGLRHLKRIRKQLLDWNRTSAPARHLSAELLSEICAALKDDVADLSELLNRDLSAWLQRPACESAWVDLAPGYRRHSAPAMA